MKQSRQKYSVAKSKEHFAKIAKMEMQEIQDLDKPSDKSQ
jgi:hypothetical protein